jgi:hypothetical protein
MLLGASSGGVVAPTLTIGSTTNYNQDTAVFNATVNTTGNRNITSVQFQYSTSASFASGNSAFFTASTNSTIAQGATSTACTYNATGLSNGTVYYVRFRVTNSSGFVTTSSIGGSFTTYSLKAYETFTGSGTWSNPRTTSGVNGLAITSILDLLVVGGGSQGAGSDFTGCGGGGGAVTTSGSMSVGSSVVVTIGAGGAAGGLFGSPPPVTATASSIAGSTTITANPGGYPYGSGLGDRAGSSGNGNLGGFQYGDAGGGGGGAGGAGQSGYDVGGGIYHGGDGGAGVSGYGVGGGGGSNQGAFDTVYIGAGGGGANSGGGGLGIDWTLGGVNGASGYAQFRYYGP